MDAAKLSFIAEDTLSIPYYPKKNNKEWCGIYVFGDDRYFILSEHIHAIHSFFVYSEYDYPLYLFINRFKTEGARELVDRYGCNINIIPIDPLKTSFEYNYFMINKVWHLLPDHKYCATFQNDGHLINYGYEKAFIEGNYDYVGAAWKDEVRIKSNILNLPAQRIGNGGASLRKPSKMLEVLAILDKYGGQSEVVKGQYNDGELRLNHHYCAEDSLFSAIGFGLGIFKPVSIEEANKFSHEPILFSTYQDKINRPFLYHRCDQ